MYWKVINGIALLFFALCTAMQYNDQLPALWMALYACPALLSLAQLINYHSLVATRRYLTLLSGLFIIYSAVATYLLHRYLDADRYIHKHLTSQTKDRHKHKISDIAGEVKNFTGHVGSAVKTISANLQQGKLQTSGDSDEDLAEEQLIRRQLAFDFFGILIVAIWILISFYYSLVGVSSVRGGANMSLKSKIFLLLLTMTPLFLWTLFILNEIEMA